MYGPLNTSNMSDAKVFFAEKDDALSDLPNEVLLMFKAQFPDVEAISTQGKFYIAISDYIKTKQIRKLMFSDISYIRKFQCPNFL